MKKIFFKSPPFWGGFRWGFLLVSLLFSNCGSKKTETLAETETTSLITLSAEQIKNANIEIGKAQQQSLNAILNCTGKIELPPQHLISVHSKVAGFMKKVNFYSGEFVKKGTLLAIVENTEFVGKQREMLEFKTKVFYAEREYNRRKNLAEGDAIAKKEIQQAEADFQNLLTAYQGIKKELEVFGFNVDNIEQTGQLQTQLSIFAPQSGFITQVNTNLGKKVSPDDELYQIIDKTDIHIELEVFAIDVPKLKDNQFVVFNIPGSTQEFKATIHTIGSLIDEKTKTVNVHCHLQNESDAKYLTAGTGITAQVKVGVHSALCVAREALVKENEAYFIFVKKGDAFEKTKVEIGISNDDFVEIKNWDNKEDVITKGAYYVQ